MTSLTSVTEIIYCLRFTKSLYKSLCICYVFSATAGTRCAIVCFCYLREMRGATPVDMTYYDCDFARLVEQLLTHCDFVNSQNFHAPEHVPLYSISTASNVCLRPSMPKNIPRFSNFAHSKTRVRNSSNHCVNN